MKFSIIVAINKNHVIGKDGKIPWHCSDDLKHFKELTMHKTIIMGSRTFKSLEKPLRGRDHIILSHCDDFNVDAYSESLNGDNIVAVYSCIDSYLDDAHYLSEEQFVIGGGSIYKQFLEEDLVDRIYLTRIDNDSDGDTYFIEDLSDEKWLKESEENHDGFSFEVYSRNRKLEEKYKSIFCNDAGEIL